VLEARTIAEAYAYIEVSIAQQAEVDFRRYSTVTRQADVWVVRFDGPYEGRHHLFELAVPVEAEARAEQSEFTYGEGQSLLVDAGQWVLVELGNAGLAEYGLEQLAGQPPADDWYRAIRRAWQTAEAAAVELVKFIPAGADEPPPSAFWAVSGREVLAANPQLFGRERVETARARYQREKDEFSARYRPDR
jgi:hypothetical protein